MSFLSMCDRDAFIKDLIPFISKSYNDCVNACPKNYIPQEPDFIAFLVRDITNYICTLLKKYIPSCTCQTQGIFCHQSPKIKFNNPSPNQKNGAELGDLLIVYNETTKNKNIKSIALLLQAKCVSSTPHAIGVQEQHQLFLYEKWPCFEYSSPKELKGIRRSIQSINNAEGSQYLMYSNNETITHTYTLAIPSNHLTCRYALASAIGKMINFDSDPGRLFTKSISCIQNDDWSNMINDIIRVAKKRCFNRKKMNMINQSRIFCLSFMSDNDLNDEINLPIGGNVENFEYVDIDDDFSGVSTVIIDVEIP